MVLRRSAELEWTPLQDSEATEDMLHLELVPRSGSVKVIVEGPAVQTTGYLTEKVY